MFPFKPNRILGLLIILTLFLACYKSWESTVYMSDELMIEDIAYGMAHGESLVIPKLSGEINLLKPPLLYWITAPLYKVLPVTPFTRRLPMIGFALGLVIVTYYLAKILFDEKTAAWSGLLLATSIPLIYFTKTTYFDLPNAFFSTAAVFLFLKAIQEKRIVYFLLCGTMEAFALLNRSYLALYLPCLFLLYTYVTGKKFQLNPVIYFILLPLLLVLPWHILAYSKAPKDFISQYLLFPFTFHAAGYIPGDYATNPLYYFILFILFPPAVFSFWFLIRNYNDKQSEKLLIILWFILYMTPLALSQTKYEWFLMPIYPVLSIAAGAFLIHVTPKLQPLLHSMVWGLTLVSIFVGPVLLLFYSVPEAENIHVADIYIDSTTGDPLYIANYPLIPVTRFFLENNAKILKTDEILRKGNNHERFFLMERPENANSLPKPQKLLYESKSYLLVYYE